MQDSIAMRCAKATTQFDFRRDPRPSRRKTEWFWNFKGHSCDRLGDPASFHRSPDVKFEASASKLKSNPKTNIEIEMVAAAELEMMRRSRSVCVC
jgi:hypothetical protein